MKKAIFETLFLNGPETREAYIRRVKKDKKQFPKNSTPISVHFKLEITVLNPFVCQ